MILDEDSPFLEICALAGYGMDDMAVGAGLVGGIGLIK